MTRNVPLYIYYYNRLLAHMRRLWLSLSSLPSRIRDWYFTNFVCYIALCETNDQYYISKRLFRAIQRAIGTSPIDSRVIFEKYYSDFRYHYRFFVNTDLSIYQTPDGNPPLTVPIQLSPLGHVGFQGVQPDVQEILDSYNITRTKTDHVPLRVITYAVNGETCFELTPRLAGRIAPPRRPHIPKSLRNKRIRQ